MTVKPLEQIDLYTRLAMNETNDCAVVSIAELTGLPYKEVHEAYREEGRKHREGATFEQMRNVVHKLGFSMIFAIEGYETEPTLVLFGPEKGHAAVCMNGKFRYKKESIRTDIMGRYWIAESPWRRIEKGNCNATELQKALRENPGR